MSSSNTDSSNSPEILRPEFGMHDTGSGADIAGEGTMLNTAFNNSPETQENQKSYSEYKLEFDNKFNGASVKQLSDLMEYYQNEFIGGDVSQLDNTDEARAIFEAIYDNFKNVDQSNLPADEKIAFGKRVSDLEKVLKSFKPVVNESGEVVEYINPLRVENEIKELSRRVEHGFRETDEVEAKINEYVEMGEKIGLGSWYARKAEIFRNDLNNRATTWQTTQNERLESQKSSIRGSVEATTLPTKVKETINQFLDSVKNVSSEVMSKVAKLVALIDDESKKDLALETIEDIRESVDEEKKPIDISLMSFLIQIETYVSDNKTSTLKAA